MGYIPNELSADKADQFVKDLKPDSREDDILKVICKK